MSVALLSQMQKGELTVLQSRPDIIFEVIKEVNYECLRQHKVNTPPHDEPPDEATIHFVLKNREE